MRERNCPSFIDYYYCCQKSGIKKKTLYFFGETKVNFVYKMDLGLITGVPS